MRFIGGVAMDVRTVQKTYFHRVVRSDQVLTTD